MRKETIKIAFNDNHSGFILSREAIIWMKEHGYAGKFNTPTGEFIVPRHNPVLVRCIEELGEKANGTLKMKSRTIGTSELRIAEIESPLYYIVNYDGKETVIGEKDLLSANGKGIQFVDSFDPDKVFFTADTHFGDQAMISLCGRPFKDVAEMDRELVRRWNETVPEDGVVFHIGDFAKGNATRWNELLRELHGTIYLILGNHDIGTSKKEAFENFASVRDQRFIEVDGQKIYLNHYPFLCYGGSYSDVWQLFGHVHSGPGLNTGLDHHRLKMLFPRQYDVGVDNNGFSPVPFSVIRERIATQMENAKSQQVESSSPLLSGTPIVFLDVDGVLSTSPLSRKLSHPASQNLEWLLSESGAGLVVTGGWAAFKVDELRNGPLKAFSGSLIGTTPQAPSHLESIAAWLSTAGGKHRYVILSTTPSDDTRLVPVDPARGLTKKNVLDAMKKIQTDEQYR